MLITDILPENKVVLQVTIGTNKLEFESVSIGETSVPKKGLLVEAMKHEDKVLGFRTSGITCSVISVNTEDKKPYIWRDVTVRTVKGNDGVVYHVLICSQSAVPINRRENYRVWLGLDGFVQLGINSDPKPVVVKDISATGISFMSHEDIDVNSGIPVHLRFIDDVSNLKFDLSGLMVRKEELKDAKKIYGCRLDSDNPLIRKYVNEKQIQQAKSVGNMDKRLTFERKVQSR